MMRNMLCIVSDLHALFHLILTVSPNKTNEKTGSTEGWSNLPPRANYKYMAELGLNPELFDF